jgi:hypothetical protein
MVLLEVLLDSWFFYTLAWRYRHDTLGSRKGVSVYFRSRSVCFFCLAKRLSPFGICLPFVDQPRQRTARPAPNRFDPHCQAAPTLARLVQLMGQRCMGGYAGYAQRIEAPQLGWAALGPLGLEGGQPPTNQPGRSLVAGVETGQSAT